MRIQLLLVSLLHVTYGTFAQEGESEYSLYDAEGQPGLEWIKREGSKYEYHFHADHNDFDGAKGFCLNEDGDLASIENAEENSWLQQHRIQSESQFIGLYNYYKNGKEFLWLWTDRSGTKYTNWRSGESKQADGDCAAFADRSGESRWYSYPCTTPRHFICKREVSPCKPNPCGDEKECKPKGKDDFECICHHCDSGVASFVAAWTGNKVLLVFGVVILLIVVLVVLVVVGSCVRGCLETNRSQRYSPVKRKNKAQENGKSKNSSNPEERKLRMEKDHQGEELYTPTPKPSPKPPVPPNKPRWTRDQRDGSPALSERGRSPASVLSDDEGNTNRTCSIQIHDEMS